MAPTVTRFDNFPGRFKNLGLARTVVKRIEPSHNQVGRFVGWGMELAALIKRLSLLSLCRRVVLGRKSTRSSNHDASPYVAVIDS